MKNIIFDLGSVICSGKPVDILKNLNLEENTYNELKRFFENSWKEINLGIGTLEDKYNECNFPKEYDQYKDYLVCYYKYRKLNIELIGLIDMLKENDYNVYILSNNNKECSTYYKNNGMFNNIDGWVVSCDYGISKPDSKLFDIILEKYNLIPEESYFIDDKERNIEEAKKHGIKTYQFSELDDINKLYLDMKFNGINI